jgi:oxygen-independent coproporphyrinogen-3 oxidase
MKKELELYIHIPFCVKKCNYCDFLSGPVTPESRKKYVDALTREMMAYEKDMKEYEVTSVFIGGGTPSLLSSEEIVDLFYALHIAFKVKPNAEITIEVNPGTITQEKLATYKKVGINRLSFGMQSAVDEELAKLGRIHNFEQFENNYTLARRMGFKNMNIDIMAGIPGQTFESYLYSLEKVLQMQPEHISSYSLIVEEGTPFYELDQQGFLNLPDEEDERLMYERTKEILEYYGYYRYEISNYAKPGFQCQHNIGYWTRREYLGLGIGAASLIDETRFTNIKDRGLYTEILEKEEICLEDLHENVEVIDRSGQMSEYMILGLRMMDGVSEDEFRELFEVSMESVYGPTIRKFCQMGLMEEQDGWINLTDSGVSVSNQILVEFM